MKTSSTSQNPFDRARAQLKAACERIKRGESTVQRDSQGNIIFSPSTVKPTIYETEHTLNADIGRPIS